MVNKDNMKVNVLPSYYTLLTNHQGCRGLEAEEVIVFVDEKDELRHVIVENSSRATSKLVFICFGKETDDVERIADRSVYNTLRQLAMERKIDSVKIKTYLDEYSSTPYMEQIEEWNGKEWNRVAHESNVIDGRQAETIHFRRVLMINTSDDGTLFEDYLEKVNSQKELKDNKDMNFNLSMLRR